MFDITPHCAALSRRRVICRFAQCRVLACRIRSAQEISRILRRTSPGRPIQHSSQPGRRVAHLLRLCARYHASQFDGGRPCHARGAAVRARAGSLDVVVVSDVSRSMASEEYRPVYARPPGGCPLNRVCLSRVCRRNGLRGAYGSRRLDLWLHTGRVAHPSPCISGNRPGYRRVLWIGF